MQILLQNHKDNPNQMVHSIYSGVSRYGGTVTAITKPSADRKYMETTRIYGPALPRGQGGMIGVLVLGGMETTLAEVRDIIAARQAKKFVPKRNVSEITQMCRLVADRRNELIMEARKRAGPKPKKKVVLHLPVGFRYVNTSEPGLRVLARI